MRIDIFFDIVCPWCYIGKRRLDRALEMRADITPEIRWQPFQLNPGMFRQGMDRGAYMTAKFGGWERARQVMILVAETAAREGLVFHLEAIKRTPNTVDAHRLIRYAAAMGHDAGQLCEALFNAYFAEGQDVGDPAVLAGVAARCGLGEVAVLAYLAGSEDAAAVRSADAAARQMGVQAVPCFVFDGRYALSGAQEPAAFIPLFDLAQVRPAAHALRAGR